jgi:Tol biopolymer transport system component
MPLMRQLSNRIPSKGTSPDDPSWSPDGKRIAFDQTPDTTPARPGGFAAEIWTMNADGTEPRRV